MKVNEDCAKCLLDKQIGRVSAVTDEVAKTAYLDKVRNIIDKRGEEMTAPYLVYLFNRAYRDIFGNVSSYGEIKREYNDLVLKMTDDLRKKIGASQDPLKTAFAYSRIGNYIDFGAMNQVDKETFLGMFENTEFSDRDEAVYEEFLKDCEMAENFLLLADNCGEIVLDKLFLEQLSYRFPQMQLAVMVRGGEVLNDATIEDAVQIRMGREILTMEDYEEMMQAGHASDVMIISNGNDVAGTVYNMLGYVARKVFDEADVILAKGQGNYETLSGVDKKVYYSFLCKCDLFIRRFEAPKLTGMFVVEGRQE